MISEYQAKRYCSEEISLIENYQAAISDQTKMWEIHHRRECDENGKTLFTCKQLVEMNLYFKRPASELIFVTKSMHMKLHKEMCSNGGKKLSIPILQFSKDGELVKEWTSAHEAERQLGIACSSINACLRYGSKSAGGFVWRHAHG